MTILLSSAHQSVAQSLSSFELKNYTQTSKRPLRSTMGTQAYWTEFYHQHSERYQALKTDFRELLNLYLSSNDILQTHTLKLDFESDLFLKNKHAMAASEALSEGTLAKLELGTANVLVSAIRDARKDGQIIPLKLSIFDDESEELLPAYYERGTHKIKMSLNRIVPQNWLTWYVHEHLHFFDPILNRTQTTVNEKKRFETIAGWIKNQHFELSPAERNLLYSYFSDLTDMSIRAEWRDWVATTLFAQKAMRSGLLKEVPPCLNFLIEFGFGKRDLRVDELKTIWWKKLKAGFWVDRTGLFAHEWLANQLNEYLNSLKEQELPIEGLLELVN